MRTQRLQNLSLCTTCLISDEPFPNDCPFCLDLAWRTVIARHLKEQPHLTKWNSGHFYLNFSFGGVKYNCKKVTVRSVCVMLESNQ